MSRTIRMSAPANKLFLPSSEDTEESRTRKCLKLAVLDEPAVLEIKTWNDWLTLCNRSSKNKNVTKVSLNFPYQSIDENDFRLVVTFLTQNPHIHITSLDLECSNFSDKSLRLLGFAIEVGVFPFLTDLNLNDNALLRGSLFQFFENLKACKEIKLKTLEVFHGNDLNNLLAEAFAEAVGKMTSLESIHLSRHCCSEDGIFTLFSSLVSCQLTSLTLETCLSVEKEVIALSHGFQSLDFSQLKSLKLQNNTLGKEGARMLAGLIQSNRMPVVQSLILDFNGILVFEVDLIMQALLKCPPVHLQELSLKENTSFEIVERLREAFQKNLFRKLRSLHCQPVRATQSQYKALVSALNRADLKHLTTLVFKPVDRDFVSELCKIPLAKQLTQLFAVDIDLRRGLSKVKGPSFPKLEYLKLGDEDFFDEVEDLDSPLPLIYEDLSFAGLKCLELDFSCSEPDIMNSVTAELAASLRCLHELKQLRFSAGGDNTPGPGEVELQDVVRSLPASLEVVKFDMDATYDSMFQDLLANRPLIENLVELSVTTWSQGFTEFFKELTKRAHQLRIKTLDIFSYDHTPEEIDSVSEFVKVTPTLKELDLTTLDWQEATDWQAAKRNLCYALYLNTSLEELSLQYSDGTEFDDQLRDGGIKTLAPLKRIEDETFSTRYRDARLAFKVFTQLCSQKEAVAGILDVLPLELRIRIVKLFASNLVENIWLNL